MAEQEIQDLKQRSVADREEIQDLRCRYETLAKKIETLEKMKWKGIETEQQCVNETRVKWSLPQLQLEAVLFGYEE